MAELVAELKLTTLCATSPLTAISSNKASQQGVEQLPTPAVLVSMLMLTCSTEKKGLDKENQRTKIIKILRILSQKQISRSQSYRPCAGVFASRNAGVETPDEHPERGFHSELMAESQNQQQQGI